MLAETRLRTELRSATDNVPTGPDLATSLHSGRRLRRRRHLVTASATTVAVAGICLAAAVVPSMGGPNSPAPADEVAPAPAGPPDFVDGTDIDATMQAVFTTYIPYGHVDDVYPSDWTRDDALPDDDFASATDWQATFSIGAHEDVLLIMGYEAPGADDQGGCSGTGGNGAPRCQEMPVDGGTLTTTGYRIDRPAAEGSDTFTYLTSYRTDSGFTVNALDRVHAGSWKAADEMRILDDAALTQVVTDPVLTFPAPAEWPS